MTTKRLKEHEHSLILPRGSREDKYMGQREWKGLLTSYELENPGQGELIIEVHQRTRERRGLRLHITWADLRRIREEIERLGL